MAQLTPMMQQYFEIKNQHKDKILFCRLGDFYEMFFDDALTASKELEITLTGRDCGQEERAPMCGIPYHAAENYIARLIEKNYKVAICEQVGDQPARGLFPRQVTRVVTPGTIIEPGLLNSDRNNFLVCLVIQEDGSGISYVDISTGEFGATQLRGEDIQGLVRSELIRLNPAEVLIPETTILSNGFPGNLTRWAAWRFEPGRCEEALRRQFQTSSLDGFGLRGQSLAIRAAGAVVQYLQETQPAALKLLASLINYSTSEFMNLDAATRRNLELTETIRSGEVHGSLLGVLDHSITPMGKRLLRQWVSKPLLDLKQIQDRQNGVAFFLESGMLRAELREALRPLGDLERLVNRILSGHANPRDLVGLRATLHAISEMLPLFDRMKPALDSILDTLNPCTEQMTFLDEAIAESPPATLQNSGVIRPGFSIELDQIVGASQHAREWIANLEAVERERTGIRSLKVGYNKVFGYYIEITHANAEMAPPEYIRKQTLVNAERYITPEMKEYETLVLNAEERIREVEARLFKEICSRISTVSSTLLATARAIAELDVLASLTESAAIGGYIRPEMTAEPALEIRDGRHPVVEQSLVGERFVPNDSIFESGEIIRIITGPNMSGKSTFLRQVALIVLMAQIGSFVPASSARIGLVDRIFTRIGAQDEIHAGQSTFMVEMIEAANILHNATPHSLLILDEIGRGTSTYDGLSIAWAVVEYIHNHPKLRSHTLFATHYHELTQLSDLLPGVRNYNVAVSEAEGKVIFLHKIIPGGADRSYGIHVAQLAGLPRPVIQRAGEILKELEVSSGKAVNINPSLPQQLVLFPETNPILDELEDLDINTLSPIEALNKLYEWRKKFLNEN